MSISRQIDCGAFNAAQSKKWGGFIGLEGNNDAVWLGISDLDRPGTRDQRPETLAFMAIPGRSFAGQTQQLNRSRFVQPFP